MVTAGRNIAAPLLFINFILYVIALGFASWCLNRYINGKTYHPSFGGNGATVFFLTFAMLASVLGIVSKFAGGTHIRAWGNDGLAAAGSLAFGYKSLSLLIFRLACKQINLGGHRRWRLRVVEAFIIILTPSSVI
ncbi:membrane protein PM19L-like [Hevea brasiliensis]|uniref:membrane protein PM19L-like n=1 Tax=Hevea brasiliensis TaxID=3981 RepID=UPI0025E7EB19|nr:membrane protein PM19L-like [Hevea brasiliensis]